MGGNALKENFYGVWGQKREEYLRTNKPEVYDSLVSSGELEDTMEEIFMNKTYYQLTKMQEVTVHPLAFFFVGNYHWTQNLTERR